MPNIFLNAAHTESERRAAIYAGAIFVDDIRPASRALADFARALVHEFFDPLDPRTAQHHLELSAFVDVLTKLKTTFTNHAQTKRLMTALLEAWGCDPEQTYFDVPRMRIVTAQGYLTSGVGYAYQAHRDTWYAAPPAQINWWAPLYDLEESQSLAFYPTYFNRPFANRSNDFDYDEWKIEGRQNAHLHVRADTRKHPLPHEAPSEKDEMRMVVRADQMLSFSAAQLHATSPNTSETTRFSIDFRTFDLRDLREKRGALNVDSRSTGSTTEDFLQMQTFAPYQKELANV